MLEGWYNDQMERTTGWYKKRIRGRLFIIGLLIALALNVDSIHVFQSLYRMPALRATLVPIAEKLADNYAVADSSLSSIQRANVAVDSLRTKLIAVKYDSSQLVIINNIIQGLVKIDSLSKRDSSGVDSLKIRVKRQADLFSSLGLPIGWMENRAPLSWFNKHEGEAKDYFDRYERFSWSNLFSYILGILITAMALQFGAPFWFDLLMKVVNMRRAGIKPDENKK
jgi:hypothetical protein